MSRFRHRRQGFGCGQVHDGCGLGTASLRCGPFLFCSLQCFMNSAHEVILWGGAWQARVLNEYLFGGDNKIVAVFDNASVAAPFPDVPLGAGAAATVIAPEAMLSLKSKSRATASTIPSLMVGF